MNLQDMEKIIIANEVPKKDMLELMTGEWKMSPELADAFFTYFGGHIRLCYLGVQALQGKGEGFEPLALLDAPGLPTCAATPAARRHLKNLARQGWSPVYDIEDDKGARLIAEKNVGGVIPQRATTFDLPQGMWKGEHEYALIPSGTLMRRKIAKELKRRSAYVA